MPSCSLPSSGRAVTGQLRIGDRSIKVAKWVRAYLERWRLGSLVQDEWDPDVVHTRQGEMPELSLEKPLDCGVPREGWLHFRFVDVPPTN
jgi:hypothetical protein